MALNTSVEFEAEQYLTSITIGIDYAMDAVAADIRDCLVEHIQHDVYDQYTSEVYPRSGNLMKGALDAEVTAWGGEAKVVYNPSGVNNRSWAELPYETRIKYHKNILASVKPKPVSGDALINRIEEGKYDYKAKVGPRPFLYSTVQELLNGRALNTFISAFNSAGAIFKLQAVDAGDQEVFVTGDDHVPF